MIRNTVRVLIKIGKYILFNILAAILLFLLIEGLSSIILLTHQAMISQSIAERVHTQYDQELGWSNTPNFYKQDMYGPGKYLKINSQLFRNNDEFSPAVPDGKIRVICSGDSFTFGYGVGNDHTWCQQLVTLENRFETLNLGLGGYGIDQSYLWYARNYMKFEHDIHIFAFITEDFNRMREKSFLGYGKPVLELRDKTLITQNVPVPRRLFVLPYAYRIAFETLRVLELIRKIQSTSDTHETPQVSDHTTPLKDIVLNVFRELYRMNRSRNSLLVLAYLPMIEDHRGRQADEWRRLIQAEAANRGWVFFDVIADFKKLSFQQTTQLFIRQGDVDYLFAQGHYNEKGNAYIAYLLYKRFLTIPEIAAKLE